MAEPIDGFKPAPRAPGASASERPVPPQQARPGWSGFLGGSYFELGASRAPSKDQHMLDPPATTGPKATARKAIAQTLEVLGLAPGVGILIPPERA
jgi:hypothetical protein